MAKVRRTGPTKKKMPLGGSGGGVSQKPEDRPDVDEEEGEATYTTGEKPWAPPQPMQMMEKVKVEMTKLCLVSVVLGRRPGG
jgi:hypothetical protein